MLEEALQRCGGIICYVRNLSLSQCFASNVASKLTNDRANEGKNAKQNSRRAKVSDQGTVYRLRGHFVPASADDAFYCSEKKIYISLSHFVYRCVVIVSKTEEEKRKNPD